MDNKHVRYLNRLADRLLRFRDRVERMDITLEEKTYILGTLEDLVMNVDAVAREESAEINQMLETQNQRMEVA